MRDRGPRAIVLSVENKEKNGAGNKEKAMTTTKSAKTLAVTIPSGSACCAVGYRDGYTVAYETPVFGQMGQWETRLMDTVMTKALAHRVVRANRRS